MKLAKTAMSVLRSFKGHKESQKYFFADHGRNREVSPPTDGSFREARNILERILTENIIPFWYPEVIDEQDGGYRLNHDLEGRYRGPANKYLVTQARTLWFLSRLANSHYGAPGHLEAARHGHAFLRDRMWDRQFGGFYWEVDSSGHSVARPEKQMYGQAFALYALTEYANATGD